MRKRQLTLLGSLLCVLTLTACNVEVNIEGDVNANIDTSIDLGDDTGDDTGSDTGEDTGEDGDGNENIPTEITLSLTASALEVTVGDSVDISFSTSPAGVSVSFSSSDTSLATVTNNGHVTTLAPGTVTITAVASLEGYNDVSESIVITINPVIDEGGDTGSGGGTGGDDEGTGGGSGSGNEPGGNEPGEEPGGSGSETISYGVEITNGASLTPLEIGDTVAVSVSLLTYTNEVESNREIATAEDVTLSSSVTGVLSINGLEITALSAGETILTATWTDKEVQSSGVSITVNAASGGGTTPTPEPEPDPEPETVTVTFNPTSYTVEEDGTVQTSLTTEPSGASVTYTSSDTNIATVNASGLVTGVKAGETVITATATYEGYNAGTATCTITVTEKASDEPGYYVLYGDFVGADWEGFPNSGDDTYLGYTSNDSKYWEVTITTLPQPDSATWNAGFRIVYAYWDPTGGDEGTGENVYETIADYSALDTVNSIGTLGEGSDGNISLHWDTTYTITIDLRDSDNPYILVIMDTTGMEYDSCYVLYGDFVESYWITSPSEESDFYLAYNSSDSSTKYWSVRATISSEPTDNEWWSDDNQWDAGFRVIAYGDDETVIANYSNLDSNSTGVVGTNNDGNICVSWNATYDIVIDMTGSTPSILVTLVTDTGDDPSIDEPVTAEYALVGDFNDSDYSWNESPSKTSDYYHYYSSADESTYTWELTVTMAAGTGLDYDPSFYVTPYGDWSAVIGFSELDGNSTGVKSNGTDDGGVCVDWGCTYDIFIDLRDSSNFSILVTLVEEEVEVNIDSYYVISGDLDGNSWKDSPVYTSDLTLPYDSTLANSKYWQRTITTCETIADQDYPGFRILNYGSWDNTIGYSDFTTISGDAVAGYDGDNNFKVTAYSTSYDVTIDMRGTSWSINIDTHVEGFEKVDGLYDNSATNESIEDYESLNLSNDYAMGMDTSSIVEVLNAGGAFYDDSGTKLNGIDDFMSYLSTKGVNYIRIRLWNDPTDGSGHSYKGGGNDLTTDLTIAEAAVKAGMKICLDLHYSDFWAHHGQQYVPKAWSTLDDSTLISTAASWTTDVLTAFSNASCAPSMVQVGNETNNNQICGLTGNSTSAINFFKNCCSAVRTFDSSIQIVIHYSDDQNVSTYKTYYDSLISDGCDFDVIGLSYYSYYHEDMSSFRSTLSELSSTYSSKKICIMEYSYGYTVDWQYVASSDTLDDQDGGVMQNEFWTDDAEKGGYDASVAGQTSYVYDVNQAVASLSNGIGSFYWEPAWLAVNGSCWASSYSASYYSANGKTNTGYDVCTWANQALFDYSGHPLTTLSIYNQMWGK